MKRGPTESAIPIGKPSVLVAADLEKLREPRHVASTPQKLRDSHHMIARLAAMGLRHKQIAEQTGYGRVRVQQLLDSPAMEELVALYRRKVDEEFVEGADAYFTLATSNMLAAERHIADAIADADEAGEVLPIRTALAISRDAADRFGYGKKTQNLNINVDFAAQLEKAIARSGKGPLLEGNSGQVPQPPTNAGQPSSPRSFPPPSVAVSALHGEQQLGAASTSPGDTHLTRRPMAQPQPLLRRRA